MLVNAVREQVWLSGVGAVTHTCVHSLSLQDDGVEVVWSAGEEQFHRVGVPWLELAEAGWPKSDLIRPKVRVDK